MGTKTTKKVKTAKTTKATETTQITRSIQSAIEQNLKQSKIIIIYGARQVGKTTLVKTIQKRFAEPSTYLNCDEPDIRQALTDKTSTELKEFVGTHQLVIIDEAQRVKNIGLTLKLLHDNYPNLKIVATGSSSFELSNQIKEPLTGRKIEFHLHPISYRELANHYNSSELTRLLETRLIFGMYPEIITTGQNAESILKEIHSSYLYKDILQFAKIKNPEILEKLLQALALQIGNEVSYNELANLLNVNKKTVASYIQILEKSFIIFRLKPLSRNPRTELKKLRKIYFYDTGLRNALINNFNPAHLRQDWGALWENFLISERLKLLSNQSINRNIYFWRSFKKQEIDYIEEYSGQLDCYEIKWRKDKLRSAKEFLENYENSRLTLINRKNYLEFITPDKENLHDLGKIAERKNEPVMKSTRNTKYYHPPS